MRRKIYFVLCFLLLILTNIAIAKPDNGKSIIRPCVEYYPQFVKQGNTLAEIKNYLMKKDCPLNHNIQFNKVGSAAKLQFANCKADQYAPIYYCALKFSDGSKINIQDALYPAIRPCLYYYKQFAKLKSSVADIKATLSWLHCNIHHKGTLDKISPKSRLIKIDNCKQRTDYLSCLFYFDDGSKVVITGDVFPGLQ